MSVGLGGNGLSNLNFQIPGKSSQANRGQSQGNQGFVNPFNSSLVNLNKASPKSPQGKQSPDNSISKHQTLPMQTLAEMPSVQLGPTLADSQGNPVIVNAVSLNKYENSDLDFQPNMTQIMGSLEVSKGLDTL